jgi:D-alanyl-D-alanine carboxypeptidase
MRDLVTTKIAEASPKRTAPMIAEANVPAPVAANPAPAARVALASAGSTPVALPPARPVVIATAAPAPAAPAVERKPQVASEPLLPIKVKTIKVKLNGVHTASLSNPSVAGLTSDETISTQSVAHDETARAPLVNPRPGVLGVLPATAVAPAPAVESPAPATRTAAAPAARPEPATPARAVQHSGWIVQVGAFPGEGEAKSRLQAAQNKAKALLGRADAFTEQVVKGDKTLYRARFAGLERDQAEAVCKQLKRNEIACLTIKN